MEGDSVSFFTNAYEVKRKKRKASRGETFLRGGGLSIMRWRNPPRRGMVGYATSVKLMRVTMPAKIAAGMTPTQILPYLRYR